MRGDPDQQLIDLARRSDRDAFSCLVRRHEGPLRTLIALDLGDGIKSRVEVDDILQETLVRAFRSLPDFAGNTEESFSRWLAGIAHHTVIDQVRHLSARKHDYRREVALPVEPTSEAGGPSVPVGELASPAPSPSGVLRRKERLDRLLDALQALSPDHRQVILLTRIEQLPVKEVARRMGRSEKAVSMLLLRALMALRNVFGETDSLSLPSEPYGPDRDGSRRETGRAP